MNTCLNCNKETNNPKFCSKSCSVSHNNKGRNRNPLGHGPERTNFATCLFCGKQLSRRIGKFCKECYDKKRNINYLLPRVCGKCKETKNPEEFYGNFNWCASCINSTTRDRQQKFKQDAIDYLGGKCIHCGYFNYNGALDFHHLDPSQKDFTLSKIRKYTLSEEVKRELDKCILLCSNCHREIHGKVWKY